MKNKTITEMLLNGIGTVAYMSGWIVWKLKKQIWFLTLIMIGMYLPLLVMQNVAFAPKAEAQLDNTQILKPTPYQQQVVDYIHVVFGKDADNFLKILSCENHALRWDAQNFNSDGSVDIGIGQINSIHGVPAHYLYDWRTNVDISYQIFKSSGFGAWTCSYMLK